MPGVMAPAALEKINVKLPAVHDALTLCALTKAEPEKPDMENPDTVGFPALNMTGDVRLKLENEPRFVAAVKVVLHPGVALALTMLTPERAAPEILLPTAYDTVPSALGCKKGTKLPVVGLWKKINPWVLFPAAIESVT